MPACSQFVRCFLHVYVRAWNCVTNAVFDSPWFIWMVSRELSTIGCFHELFFPVSCGVGACGVAPVICKAIDSSLDPALLNLIIIIIIIQLFIIF